MVVQVLADLLPAMIPDYAQAPTVYVEQMGVRVKCCCGYFFMSKLVC